MNGSPATLDDALAMDDTYAGMLEVACLLADKVGRFSEAALTPQEQRVRLVTWVDCQVCNGGWEQWLANTSARGLAETLDALGEIGCHATRELAEAALAIASVGVGDTDEAKDRKLDQLTDAARHQLAALDSRFYEPAEDYMTQCRDYIVANRSAFVV